MIKKYGDFIVESRTPKDQVAMFKKFFMTRFDELTGPDDPIDPRYPLKVDGKVYQQRDKKEEAIKYFKETRDLFALKVEALSHHYTSWFSSLASSNSSPEEDFKEMQSLMDKSGFTMEIIKILFGLEVTDSLNEPFSAFASKENHGNKRLQLDGINGYVDTYLYLLNTKLELDRGKPIQMGGLLLGDDPSEWIIKYAYGYHKTLYGKLYLRQNGLTPEKFVSRVFDMVKGYLKETFEGIFFEIKSKVLSRPTYTQNRKKGEDIWGTGTYGGVDWSWFDEFDVTNYTTMEYDRFTIHYTEIYNSFIENYPDVKIGDETFFVEQILNGLFDVEGAFDVKDTGYDLVFTENPLKEEED